MPTQSSLISEMALEEKERRLSPREPVDGLLVGGISRKTDLGEGVFETSTLRPWCCSEMLVSKDTFESFKSLGNLPETCKIDELFCALSRLESILYFSENVKIEIFLFLFFKVNLEALNISVRYKFKNAMEDNDKI